MANVFVSDVATDQLVLSVVVSVFAVLPHPLRVRTVVTIAREAMIDFVMVCGENKIIMQGLFLLLFWVLCYDQL